MLAADITTNLSAAYAYPVPFKPSNGDSQITFVNLAADSTIKIYTIMGELVKTIVAGGRNDFDVGREERQRLERRLGRVRCTRLRIRTPRSAGS